MKQKKRKINKKGFTLIELLAVIVILGVLMMAVIPAMSRYMENSRRDVFADTAKEYVRAVRNAVTADEIVCGGIVASATSDGTYYFSIDTTETDTKSLMESGGKSPFGGSELKGYVKWVKATTTKEETETTEAKTTTTVTYSIVLSDTGKHGFTSELSESEIRRGNINTALGNDASKAPSSGGTKCIMG